MVAENADSLMVNLTLTAVPNSARVSLSVLKSDSPSDLRRKTAEATKIPLDTLRLIFRGRLIGDQLETNVVDEFKLEEGCVIHCMGKPTESAPHAAATTSPAGPTVTMTSSTFLPPAAGGGDPLQTALTTLRSSNSAAVFAAAVSTLDKVLANITSHPLEEKYRKLKRENAAFQRRLGGLRGGHDAMLAVGFTVVSTDGDESYVIQPSPEAWPKLVSAQAVISQAVRDSQSAAGVSAPPVSTARSPMMGMPGMGSGIPGMPPGGLTPEMHAAAAQMMSDPHALQGMLQNPMVQNMIRNDPRFANNPMLQQSIEQLANNPEMMSQMSQMMNDPAMRSRMQAMMGGTGGMPGGGIMPPTQPSAQQVRQQRTDTAVEMSDQEMTEEEMLQEAIQRSLRES